MREARTLASWVIALFAAGMLAWMSVDTLAPQPPARNHLFEVLRDSSDIAYFEPTGRFVFGLLATLIAVLLVLPFTRRLGAILGVLLMLGMGALVVQLMMLGIAIPVDTVGEAGAVTTAQTDASGLFYLIVGLLAALAALVFVHPGRSGANPAPYYAT